VVLPEALLYTKDSIDRDLSADYFLKADRVFECCTPCLMKLGSEEEKSVVEEQVIIKAQ